LAALHHSCLKHYFPEWRQADRLPREIHDWAAETRRGLRNGAAAGLPRVLAVEKTGSRLLLRYFPIPHRGLVELHLAIWRRRTAVPSATEVLSLREQEVLRWIAEGKRDAEIGIILGLSPKTVSKHVEHVLAKLQVTNRTAALALV
jgi:DNA-binding CsgD family transcriptional regulator